jgi:hypothetical protein
MTPIQEGLTIPIGNYLNREDWMRAVVRTVLDAAAADDDILKAVTNALSRRGLNYARVDDASAAISALKETLR